MTKKEKLELYYRAKEAYYNGQEIMTDYEFDELEKELGLENKSEVGAKKNPSYTVKHPFVMGSISKVQIHKDKEGNIDWNKYYKEAKKFFGDNTDVIITPKYDGCSFEVDIFDDVIQSISTRGDGSWGKDLTRHLAIFIPDEYVHLGGHYTLRGEVLVKKDIFEKKYAEEFTNPRSFVAGVIGRDYNQFDTDFQSKLMDLSIKIYDYRRFEDGEWIDHEWTELPKNKVLPNFAYEIMQIDNENKFAEIYNNFSNYRKLSEYALDGIVIKPIVSQRINNINDARPKDCVAIKFIPMLEETEVLNITWQLGKTGEYTPIIWVKPVEMDGRMVQKCSGHNIGYLKSKGVTIGAKVIMSLAGDIIPFLYKITQENIGGEIPMPTDHEYFEDDIHLMAILSEEDKCKYKFINSANSLQIPTIGEQTAKQIFNYLNSSDETTDEFFGIESKKTPFNILMVNPEDIYFGAGCGKLGENARKSFKKTIESLSLNDIIKSCNFKFCGDKVTEQVVKFLMNETPDWSHLATEGYNWVYDNNSDNYKELKEILDYLGKTIEDFKVQHTESSKTASNQIPIIMTGEPNNYSTKSEFLKCHPEYRNTTSWKEVQIVFTNSLDSNTGKMKKAREKNIKIELY